MWGWYKWWKWGECAVEWKYGKSVKGETENIFLGFSFVSSKLFGECLARFGEEI